MSELIMRSRAGARRALVLLVAMLVALPLTAAAALVAAAPATAHEGHGDTDPFKALVFSKTAGFRHGSIPTAVAAIEQLGADHGFTVDATEDATAFTEENLAQYDVVIWVSTTGDVLDADQQAAFEGYIEAGGGYAGIHAASDTEYDWQWYGDLVGAYFKGHPAEQDVTVKVEDPAHPSTADLPAIWERFDELYNYRTNPRGKVHVLASYDESSYTGGDMGVEHPITWCQDYEGGRSWYTGMGHTDASWADAQFLDHVLGGIRTAAGVLPADCAATLPDSFEKVTLDDNTANPMELAIAEDGRVFYVDRNGEVRIVLPNGNVVKSGEVDVYTGQEFGLLGLALDPDFATNNWIYLYYSPQGAGAIDRVSRFTVDGNVMDAASETTILEIPVQRDQCCHAGGSLEFDHDGDLYIATGDNTNPFDSDGYNPIDERPGRSAWDAQRSAANTNSLSGKVLRITPLDEGGYDVPEGNLFEEGTELTRPEIYAMGFRNPFRIGLDEQNNKLIVADYGPDAGADNANRGPNGRVEWNLLSEPGNYGWPYCVGANTPYRDYDFATSTSGPAFDCSAPTNDSPNNTGLTTLPPAIAATMWQSNGAATSTPEIGSSGAPMTSGTYSYDPDLDSETKWPAYFDQKAIWADWNNSRLFTVQVNDAGDGYTDISRFLPDLPMTRPHALQFGPDGALYMIEWGSGFGGDNADSGIYRIDYVQGNRAPIARATADQTSGPAPLTVQFDGSESRDPDGTPLTYAWDFDGDGETDSTEVSPSHEYTTEGDYTARLTVTDEDGRTAVSNLDIVVGNTAPTVELVLPPDGGFFEFGDTMKYEVVVTDPEDAEIDCSRVVVQPALGHDEHAHGYEQYTGCSGTLPLPGDAGHVGANIFGTITATYTDGGHDGVSRLKGQDTVVVHTKRKEAEFFDSTGRLADSTSTGDAGVVTETTSDTAGGGQNAGYIEPGDWFAWDVMNLTKIDEISLRAASPNDGSDWEVRTGSPTGPAVATLTVPNTGGWQVYQDVSAEVSGETTTVSGPLYFVQLSGGTNVNWIDFVGDGVTDNRRPVLTADADVTSGVGPLEVAFTASATDPDGDEPITFAWTFGDGGTSTEADPTHTYTEPGTYAAKVVATDARGATATKTITIKVNEVAETCFTGRSDGFDGSELSTSRWDAIVRPSGNATVADGVLSIPLTATDIYGAGGTAVPDIVLQHLPGGAFTVTTKVEVAAVRQYQQAGLIVYGDDDNYLKLVVQGRTAEPDKSGTIVQFAKEVAGTATETNTNGLGADVPDTIWLRITSPDGLNVSASYSHDGSAYTDLAGARDLSSINEPRVGLVAFANNAAAAGINAEFDFFQLTPDDTATPCEEEPEEPGAGAPTATISASPAAPNGAAGWWTTPVSVTVAGSGGTGDLSLEHRVDGGPWTAYAGPVVVSADGTHEVQARARDAEGAVSEVVSTAVKVDRTAPVVTVTGIEDGQELNAAASRTAVVTTSDGPSGIASSTMSVDGKPVASPVRLDAVRLGAGTHQLVVTAVDQAGLTTTRTVTFRVTATYGGGTKLLKKLDRRDQVSPGLARKLTTALKAAQRADANGKPANARKALKRFIALANQVSDKDARTALKDLARQLRKQL